MQVTNRSETVNREELQYAVDAVSYWYHAIDLPYGIKTPGWAPLAPESYRIPDDLTGKTVLDVGAWDGYWTIQASQRGATMVYALENFTDTVGAVTNADRSAKWRTMRLCLDALDITNVHLLEGDIEDISTCGACCADVVFCFGVLYHLRHPMMGLMNLRKLCRGQIHIETAILDGCQSAYTKTGYTSDDCCFEFFPNNEYGLNSSNWWVGTLKAWCGLVGAAGFRDIESWKLTDDPKHVSEARGFIRATI